MGTPCDRASALALDNPKAHVDLNKKFGAPREKALSLMRLARQAGLDMAGIAFHVAVRLQRPILISTPLMLSMNSWKKQK